MQRLRRSLVDPVLTYVIVAWLGIVCLSYTLLALPAYYVLSRRWGAACGRFGIMAGFRLYAWTLQLTRAYRLDLSAIDQLRGGPPLLLAPNHPSLIDAVLILTRHPNLVCVMKEELLHNVFLGAGSRLARYVPSNHPRQMIRRCVEELRLGATVLLFPEGTRSTRFPVNRLTCAVGVIAREANVPVQTLIIQTDSPYLSKGWGLFRVPRVPITYRVALGRRFDPPQDVKAFMEELEREYVTRLSGALQEGWLSEAREPPASHLVQTGSTPSL
jgi:1-acyl-sn-glycerol-3-phosphate acyltransferase